METPVAVEHVARVPAIRDHADGGVEQVRESAREVNKEVNKIRGPRLPLGRTGVDAGPIVAVSVAVDMLLRDVDPTAGRAHGLDDGDVPA